MPYSNAERQRRWRDRQRQLRVRTTCITPTLFGGGGEVSSAVKRTVRYLAICPNLQLFDAVLNSASDDTVRVIANAAYKFECGRIFLLLREGELFQTHQRTIATLASPMVSVNRKREAMKSQNGGYLIVPTLIESALRTLGNQLFEDTSCAEPMTNF